MGVNLGNVFFPQSDDLPAVLAVLEPSGELPHSVVEGPRQGIDHEEGETEKVPDLSPAPRARATTCVDYPGTFVRKKLGLSIAKLKRGLGLQDVDADRSARKVRSRLISARSGGTLGGGDAETPRRTPGVERRADRLRLALLPLTAPQAA
jgi:hypothetical protein